MKHYRYFISLLGAITLMTACDFLDVVPDDAPTIEDAFKNRAAAEKALFTCYSFLPDPTNPYDYPAYFTSHDEFEIGSMHWIVGTAAYAIANGQQNANSPKQNYWPTMYRAIRYCNIFLEGIGTPRDIPEYERKRWIAEVKFLKAYYHYWLVSLYGPVAIVDRNLDISTPTEETMVYREPVDECIDYIVNLLEEAAPDLPTNSRPSAMMPTPTPVPRVNKITLSCPLALPRTCSAHTAELASFSTTTGLAESALKSVSIYPSGMLPTEPVIRELVRSTVPAVETATASI